VLIAPKPIRRLVEIGAEGQREIVMPDPFPLEVVDSSKLTDAEWSEIGKLKKAYELGGEKALEEALQRLANENPVSHFIVLGAFFPEEALQAFKDWMAEAGMTVEDLRQLMRKLESPARDQ
jgi:hypothetical protein